MKIAVIGSGISGLSAARYLSRRHEVTLFEQDERIGGHTNTISVPTATGTVPVDTGWIVYNGVNYPNLTGLFRELDIATRDTQMSFSVSLGDGAYEWKGSDNLFTVFAQPANLFRPSHYRLLLDILRLNKRCNALLKSGVLPSGSLGEFLHLEKFSPELRSRYLLPMAGMIWSCSPKKAMEYPAADFMRFFDSHGLFTTMNQPQWQTVIGGSHTYVRKILSQYGGGLRLNAGVTGLRRRAGGVSVHTAQGEERFEQVVCATHSDQALALLQDAAMDERLILGGIPYNRSRVVLHTDTSFLPRRKAAWASWNYLHPRDEIHDQRISGSYWMNLLQGIPGPTQYVVTLNPQREIPRDRILYDTVYDHPHYGAGSVTTHARLAEIQGRGGLWWAGAWCGYGFHEDGLKAGLRAVRGIDPDCLPAWVTSLDTPAETTPASRPTPLAAVGEAA
ncbi:MAG: FAD-dependent oxidoreductase [Nevskiaceae bacterium]|nr:MAG: FAD-dependent oxidoreductase [Nevskiaceae bacterium]